MSEEITVSYFRYRSITSVPRVEDDVLESCYLVFMIEGEMTYTVNGEPVTIREGEAMFLTDGTHRRRDEASSPVRYYSMLFSGKEGLEADKRRIGMIFTHKNVPEIMWCLSMIDRSYVARYYDEGASARRIARLLSLLLDFCAEASSNARQSRYVEIIVDYIRKNYRSKLRISDIAAHVHLNTAYCSTLFKEETGMTIGSFIKKYRLDIACDEILAGGTVRDAAEAAGFSDPYNFSKWFSKNTGMPPSEYRARAGVRAKRKK